MFVGSVCEREAIGLGTGTSKPPPIAPAQALAKRQGQERHIFLEHMSAVSAAVSLGTVNIEFSFNLFYLGGVNIRNAFHHIWSPRWCALPVTMIKFFFGHNNFVVIYFVFSKDKIL